MAARAIWKGRIRFGGVDLPVKLYSGVQDRAIHFRLLDSRKKQPVHQQMVNPETGKVVEKDEIRRAAETPDGDLVLLDEDELQALQPEPSRDIEVTRFVPPESITHQWYDRPYYLGPDEGADEAYFALVQALAKQDLEGVVTWTMRNKEYAGALRVRGDYLMLITLRRAGEVIPASALTPPGGRDLDARELRMAKQLIGAMEDELDFAAYRDEYRDRVLELVEAKSAGKVLKFPKARPKKTDESLADVLEKSLKARGKERASA
jgi:DNA end-binding protein Ku